MYHGEKKKDAEEEEISNPFCFQYIRRKLRANWMMTGILHRSISQLISIFLPERAHTHTRENKDNFSLHTLFPFLITIRRPQKNFTSMS